MSADLNPLADEPLPDLIRYGLARAIQIHTEDLRAQHPQLRFDLDLVDDEYLLPRATCLALFQVYTTASENALQRQARVIYVRYYPLRQDMSLEVRDDGQPLQAANDLSGRRALEEQIRALGGELEIIPQIERGLRVRARVPINRVE